MKAAASIRSRRSAEGVGEVPRAEDEGKAGGELDSPAPPVLVALSGSENSETLVLAGKELAEFYSAPLEAIHIETPDSEGTDSGVAEALGFAASNGAVIATIPAATVVDGISAHLEIAPAKHVVLGGGGISRTKLPWRSSILDALARRRDGLVLHVITRAPSLVRERHSAAPSGSSPAPAPIAYVYALAFVAGTLLLAEGLQLFTGPRSLDLLFLFPVIAISAWLGLRPALLAVAVSVIGYNYFLLVPAFSFEIAAPQNLVMAAVLVAIAIYTSIVTARMRGRLHLSDRSARENANLAALAQRLTRDADWESTALTICEYVHSLLKVRTIVFREVNGILEIAAAVPPETSIGPVDRATLDWVWANCEPAGAGTDMLSAADWQFHPLHTSLGILAVLGLARDDGRDPVRPDQRILLSTLVAQAALAQERLRLEDLMRIVPPASSSQINAPARSPGRPPSGNSRG